VVAAELELELELELLPPSTTVEKFWSSVAEF
jgi:hypothetical protein